MYRFNDKSFKHKIIRFIFSKQLFSKAVDAVAPGKAIGEHGDGHVRIELVENDQRIRQAVRNIKTFLRENETQRAS